VAQSVLTQADPLDEGLGKDQFLVEKPRIPLPPMLPPLLNRADELARLRGHWERASEGSARLVVVYGRRQVGKTFLLRHLREQLPVEAHRLYFTALQAGSQRQQLDAFRAVLANGIGDRSWVPEGFGSWSAALAFVADTARRTPTLLVLDEVPCLIEADRTFASALQQAWDGVRLEADPPRLLVVLSGSAVATMTGLLAPGRGALFGRPDDELQLQPFTLAAARRHVLADVSADAALEVYAATGGYPRHLLAWDQSVSTTDNLLALYGSPGGLLLRNGRQLLIDLPEEGGHRAVLAAIGTGEHRRSAIGARVGQRIERPLELLERSLLVRHERPVGAPVSSAGRFVLADTFLACWYALCHGDEGDIEAGLGAEIIQRRQGRWTRHLADVFEAQARQHALRLQRQGLLPKGATVGRWWTTSGQPAEIDVLGLQGRRTVLIGEVKWQAQPLDRRLFASLQAKRAAAPDPVPDVVLATWSRGGASRELTDLGVRSWTVDDIVAS